MISTYDSPYQEFHRQRSTEKTESLYRQVQPEEINDRIEEEEERYVRWKALFDKALTEERKDALQYSVHRVFRSTFTLIQGSFGLPTSWPSLEISVTA